MLVGIVPRSTGPTILLTRRTEHLSVHAGEVSFPGGRKEPGDHDMIAVALRESEEELGLERQHVEVLGTLPDYRTITDYTVTPVLGLVDPACTLDPDPTEVAELFELPLAVLRDPAMRVRHRRDFRGAEVQYWVIRYEGQLVWGATAAILVGLSDRLDRVDPAYP